MAAVTLSSIVKSFGPVQVLHGVSLDIGAGEFVSLLGASGCGKTTLLRAVAGLETIDSGSVAIGGQDVTRLPPERRNIAMMFQSYALLPHLTVYENVRFPLAMRRIGDRDAQDAAVKAALGIVQLSALAGRRPRQLSGGQQQRVALARAIVSQPAVLLLDEPLSNLDARLRADMQVELIEIHRRTRLTTLFVTHDQEEALSLSDRVVLINGGRIEQQGAPEAMYAQPATGFAADFLGSANRAPVTVERTAAGAVAHLAGRRWRLGPAPAPEGLALMAFRQEDAALLPGEGPDGAPVRVRTRVFLGARCRYVVRLEAPEGAEAVDFSILAPSDCPLRAGDAARLVVPPDRIRLLPG